MTIELAAWRKEPAPCPLACPPLSRKPTGCAAAAGEFPTASAASAGPGTAYQPPPPQQPHQRKRQLTSHLPRSRQLPPPQRAGATAARAAELSTASSTGSRFQLDSGAAAPSAPSPHTAPPLNPEDDPFGGTGDFTPIT